MSVAWPAGAVSKGAYLHHLTSMFYNHFQLLSMLISVLSSNCFPTGSTTYLPTIFFDSNHHPAPRHLLFIRDTGFGIRLYLVPLLLQNLPILRLLGSL